MAQRVGIIIFGPSQSGKSLFIQSLLLREHRDAVKVGTGDGNSVTVGVQTYPNSSLGVVQEYAGLDDTRLLQTDNFEERFDQSKLGLADNHVTAVKFLFFESLGSDTAMLRQTLQNAQAAYGQGVADHAVVVLSKRDRADEDELPGRVNNILTMMDEFGLGNDVHYWQGRNNTEDERLEMIADIRISLEAKESMPVKFMQDLETEVRTRAQRLCDNQTPILIRKMNSVEYTTMEERARRNFAEMHPLAYVGLFLVTSGLSNFAVLGHEIVNDVRGPKLVEVRKTRQDEVTFEHYRPATEFLVYARRMVLRERRILRVGAINPTTSPQETSGGAENDDENAFKDDVEVISS